jgi:hypothetical protein
MPSYLSKVNYKVLVRFKVFVLGGWCTLMLALFCNQICFWGFPLAVCAIAVSQSLILSLQIVVTCTIPGVHRLFIGLVVSVKMLEKVDTSNFEDEKRRFLTNKAAKVQAECPTIGKLCRASSSISFLYMNRFFISLSI